MRVQKEVEAFHEPAVGRSRFSETDRWPPQGRARLVLRSGAASQSSKSVGLNHVAHRGGNIQGNTLSAVFLPYPSRARWRK